LEYIPHELFSKEITATSEPEYYFVWSKKYGKKYTVEEYFYGK
jgi:hypothetical protein